MISYAYAYISGAYENVMLALFLLPPAPPTIPRQGKTVEQLGEDFGSYCAAWEDGACSSTSCLNATGGPGHKCGTLKECTALWPSDSNGVVNYDQSQPWCCDAWCYVDKTTCTDAIQVPACERAV